MGKRLSVLCMALLLLLLAPAILRAEDRLDSLEIELFLHQDGSASVVEIWRTEVSSGTENYKPFGNLQDAVIRDFVLVANGETYLDVGLWNSNLSSEQKAGKSGILPTRGGLELCWGIGRYAYYTYELHYTIDNFVQRYSDYLGIYWQFVSQGMFPLAQKVSVTLQSDTGFKDEAIRVWAFGFSGGWKIVDDQVIAVSDKAMSGTDFVELMLRLPLGYLETSSYRSGTFADAMAGFSLDVSMDLQNEGTALKPVIPPPNTAKPGEEASPPRGFENALFYSLFGNSAFFLVLVVLVLMLGTMWANVAMQGHSQRDIAAAYKGVHYDAEFIPDDDLFADYYLLKMAKLCTMQGLIQALFVRWVSQGYLYSESDPEEHSRREVVLHIKRAIMYADSEETELYRMFLDAAEPHSEIKFKEFLDWLREHKPLLTAWYRRAEKFAKERALTREYIQERGFLFLRSQRLTPLGIAHLSQLLSFREHFDQALIEAAQGQADWEFLATYATLIDVRDYYEDDFRILFERRADLAQFRYLWTHWTLFGSLGGDFTQILYAAESESGYMPGVAGGEIIGLGGISSGGGGGMGGASGGGRR